MELFLSFSAGIFLGCILAAIFFNNKFISQNKDLARLEAENENLAGLSGQNSFLSEFENIANKILKQNSEEFSKVGKKEIDAVIKPFRDKIVDLTDKIEKNRLNEAKELSSLETQIKLLSQNNQKICDEANNLASAIKGDSKTRGNWGEVILERILEISGLQKGIHYDIQQTFRNVDDEMLRPDVIIYMPEDRHLVVDSKVSLVAYERFYNCEENKEKHLKDFLAAVKEHIKSLRSKYYQGIKDLNSPDFVLMFIPVESSFNLLLQNDCEILDFARKNNILLISPSTLLVTLKTIELFWQQENQNKNVVEIAEESGKLYDKFVGLLTDMEVLKNSFSKTLGCFDNINIKLDGKGGLIRQAEKIKDLGAKTSKKIPENLLN